jgi:DnaJ-class molecular chaperone
MNREKACEILGISEDLRETAKKAYIRLSKEKHPDKGGDPAEFLLLHEAYKTLVEMEAPNPIRQDNVDFEVKVSLEEAVHGVMVETHIIPSMIATMALPTPEKTTARAEILTVLEKLPPVQLLLDSISVTYPEQKIGGILRDITIRYKVKEHHRYKPCLDKSKGLLCVEERVPVLMALNGGIIEVDTLFGPRKLHIKAGTNIGDSYVIKKHGPLGGLEVVIAGLEMPEVDKQAFVEEESKRQKEVEEEERLLEENKLIAEQLKSEKKAD